MATTLSLEVACTGFPEGSRAAPDENGMFSLINVLFPHQNAYQHSLTALRPRARASEGERDLFESQGLLDEDALML